MYRLIIWMIVALYVLLWSEACSPRVHYDDQEVCECGEEEIWKLILNHRAFVKPTMRKGAIVIDDAYCVSSRRMAFREYFKCNFFYSVLSPHRDTTINDYESWKRAQFAAKHKDIRVPIGVAHVAEGVEDVYFMNIEEYFNSKPELPLFGPGYGATWLYVYPEKELDPCGTDYQVVLDENGDFGHSFKIDLKTCKLVGYHRDFYENYHCTTQDWTELIDFNTTIDSFYQYQYIDVMRRLDSITLVQDPDHPKTALYRNFPQFKGKW